MAAQISKNALKKVFFISWLWSDNTRKSSETIFWMLSSYYWLLQRDTTARHECWLRFILGGLAASWRRPSACTSWENKIIMMVTMHLSVTLLFLLGCSYIPVTRAWCTYFGIQKCVRVLITTDRLFIYVGWVAKLVPSTITLGHHSPHTLEKVTSSPSSTFSNLLRGRTNP